ncbi:hypothetical protein N7474_008595 [Penicillium riverlandense]|uniref:uncharacterized protein n=1 Tax=Penicillium riverlandense TaxID=1903569 RepID=UPI002548771A|nr:uncharacterized protein N7474_008595 [Penicillium riverlandense]KAJ5812294.1 hypothetical protein N7474_008595 [Penicillium riverlandense]
MALTSTRKVDVLRMHSGPPQLAVMKMWSRYCWIMAASINGHEKVVQKLLDHGAEVNAQGGTYGNALGGYEKVVQILLDHGVEVNAQGGVHGNALYAVSSEGHDKVVQMLLDRGAEYCNALQAAASGGHEKVVQMLLEHGANVNARCGRFDNTL